MTGLRLHEGTGLVALHALGTHPFALASLCIITEVVLAGTKLLFRRIERVLPAHRATQVFVHCAESEEVIVMIMGGSSATVMSVRVGC
jgi:hypothetical protein